MDQRDDTSEGFVLRVLGPTVLERDGQALAIGGPRQRAVLVRLALAEGRLVPAERLVEDVWGPDAQSSIVATLHSYVSRLRSSIGDNTRLRRDGPGYVLDLGEDEVDARIFERDAGRARDLVASDPAAAVVLLDRVLGMWRGPAYADVLDMDAASAAAVRLDELHLGAIEARFDALLGLGRHDSVVAELERVVDEHLLRERFTAQLMLALYRGGRQADALRAYERTRRHLIDELGLDPSPGLVKLESAILAHDPSLAAPAVEPRPGVPAAATTATAGSPAPGTPDSAPLGPSPVALPPSAIRHGSRPFVGRAAALEDLRTAWSAALTGKRRFVLIEGEAGAGKSRLAAQFANEAHGNGAVVLWGRATTEAIVPYEPLVEALRTVLRTVSPEARRRVVEGRDGLALLMPFLADLDIGVEVAKPEIGTDRYVLFETVAELLDAESAVWPLVFVLDDLQWSDPLSLRLLHHLLHHERSARLLAVSTVRTVPVTPNAELDTFLADLTRDGLLSRITLEGLNESEIAELLDGEDASRQQQAAEILRTTHGNPFFVTELVEHGRGSALPASVRDVIGTRLDRLPTEPSRLVTVAAVAGTNTSLPVLAWATGLNHEDLLDAIDATIDAGLLAEEEASGSLVFRHALVRQVALARLSRSRRSTIHLTLADALTALGSTPHELAHHLVEAGGLAAPERVVAASVAAGRDALDVLAYEEAEQWAQRALAVAGLTDPRLRCDAFLLSSDAHRALGDRTAARTSAAQAAAEARRSADPLMLARSAEAMALARAGPGFDFGTQDAQLDALLKEALDGLPHGEVDHRVRLLGASMSNAAAEGDLLALKGLGDEALALAESNEHHALVATVHLTARMAGWRVDLLEQRLATDRAGWAAAEKAGSINLQLSTLLYGIADLVEAGSVAEAEEWFARFRERAATVRQPVYDAFVGFIDGTLKLLRGEYDESAKLADEALLRGLQSHGVNAEQAWAGQAFIRAWDRGHLDELTELAEKAQSQAPNMPVWRVALGACLVAAGRAEEARPVLEELVTEEEGIRQNTDSMWLVVGGLLVEIARELGDRERARILRRELEPYVGRITMSGLGRASLGPVTRFVGLAAHVAGDLDAADDLLRAAAEQAHDIGAVPHEARALHDRALVLEERDGAGDADEAADLRQQARGLADSIGLVLGGLGAASRT